MTDATHPFSDQTQYPEHAEWIAQHIDNYFDEDLVSVFHEIVLFDIHLDIYFIKPKNAKFNILLTSGMSTLKMNVSGEAENPKDLEFAELMILVPKDIAFEDVYTGEHKNDWIISMLKRTARFPHYYNTWIGIGHSIQAEEDFSPYGKDTEYVGALILPSVTFDKDFTVIVKDGRQINIYSILPLYKNELEYKIEHGYNKFLDLLIKANGEEVLDINRKNLVSKASFWNRLFRN
ncbi:MAG: suppressor of fused domain protein [Bacteroidota bacterium]